MRGKNQHEQQKQLEAVNYLHGRLELEIEYYCHHQGLDPLEVTPFVGARLVGASMDHVSTVLQKTRPAHSAAPKVEVAHRAHGRGAQTAEKRSPSKAAPDQVSHQARSNRTYWDKLSPEKRRMKKWSLKAKAKWGGKGKKHPKTKERQAYLAKQRVYQKRHAAKQRGETPPPLPKKEAA